MISDWAWPAAPDSQDPTIRQDAKRILRYARMATPSRAPKIGAIGTGTLS